MTGPQHFLDAQQFAEASVYAYQKWGETGRRADLRSALWQQAQGQLHATLALAAATVTGLADHPAVDWDAWRPVVSDVPPPKATQ